MQKGRRFVRGACVLCCCLHPVSFTPSILFNGMFLTVLPLASVLIIQQRCNFLDNYFYFYSSYPTYLTNILNYNPPSPPDPFPIHRQAHSH